MSQDSFYKAFEDKFRGDRDSIKARLKVYLPFLEPLKSIYSEGEALDLGCGRGEWLELLREIGIKGKGIDINEDMISECNKRGLKAHKAEAVSFLSSIPNESLIAVTGFHIAEHLEFSKLHELVKQAFRVLNPGGLLILETPNPENITVGSKSFYLDPTHVSPLPSQLLSFLCEYSGFFRTKVLYLQENPAILSKEAISISDVLGGVSPDYAVVAQKEPSLPEHKELFDPAFNKKYGLTLNELTDAYDKQVITTQKELMDKQTALAAAQARAKEAEDRALKAEQRASNAEQRVMQLDQRVQGAEARAQESEQKAQQLFEQAQNLHNELQQVYKVYNSWSRRITMPLRVVSRPIRRLMPSALKPQLKTLLRDAAFFIGRRPALKRTTLVFLNRFPNLKSRLERIVVTHYENQVVVKTPHQYDYEHNGHDMANLTPRARQIYVDLKAEIEKREISCQLSAISFQQNTTKIADN